MVNAGVFGPKLSGKSTLARHLSMKLHRDNKLQSIVLDPHDDVWGPQALVFTDEDKFWSVVWKSKRCVVFVEEAAATIRRERSLVPVFTRLRHCEHKLVI